MPRDSRVRRFRYVLKLQTENARLKEELETANSDKERYRKLNSNQRKKIILLEKEMHLNTWSTFLSTYGRLVEEARSLGYEVEIKIISDFDLLRQEVNDLEFLLSSGSFSTQTSSQVRFDGKNGLLVRHFLCLIFIYFNVVEKERDEQEDHEDES
ncbi:35669_t:CDS:2 [Gigaspora margarita]|uniref:35669_t:CDS:1 n=1 Tax=Gigaspora margarita TaxID=4874 RepID=A0ABN7VZU4_GIGMA|nr:35669_t:CDS:2 [Gigaspora margarita]